MTTPRAHALPLLACLLLVPAAGAAPDATADHPCDNFGSEPTRTLCETVLGGLPCDILVEPWYSLCHGRVPEEPCDAFGSEPTHTLCERVLGDPCDVFAEPWATVCRTVLGADLPCEVFAEPWRSLCEAVEP